MSHVFGSLHVQSMSNSKAFLKWEEESNCNTNLWTGDYFDTKLCWTQLWNIIFFLFFKKTRPKEMYF